MTSRRSGSRTIAADRRVAAQSGGSLAPRPVRNRGGGLVPDAGRGDRQAEHTLEPVDAGGALGRVRRAVEARHPVDAREASSRQRILAELDRLDWPFDRDADPVHVTGSAVVAGPQGTVLHRHKRLGRWMQPGGHLDAGELPAAAACREAHEETGLTVRHVGGSPLLVHVDVHDAADGHVHLDLRYLVLADGDDLAPAPGESPAVAWFSWSDALDRADASLRGALRSAMAVLQAIDQPAACQ